MVYVKLRTTKDHNLVKVFHFIQTNRAIATFLEFVHVFGGVLKNIISFLHELLRLECAPMLRWFIPHHKTVAIKLIVILFRPTAFIVVLFVHYIVQVQISLVPQEVADDIFESEVLHSHCR